MIHPKITDAGKKINADSFLHGQKNYIEFTKIVLGDGEEKNSTHGMQHAVLSIRNIETKKLQKDLVLVRAVYYSSDIVSDFYYRELGLYAIDQESKKEVLYLYGYETSEAEFIRKTDSSALQERAIDLHIKITDAANIVMNIHRDSILFENNLLSVPEELWEANAEFEAYPFRCIVPLPGISGQDILQGSVDITTEVFAQECNLANVCSSGEGSVTFYACKRPTQPILYHFAILKGVK